MNFYKFFLNIFLFFILVIPILTLASCSDDEIFDGKTCVKKGSTPVTDIKYNFQLNVACKEYKYPWCRKEVPKDIADFVGKFYTYTLAVIGITALGVIIFGGIKYTGSAFRSEFALEDDKSAVNEAEVEGIERGRGAKK